MNTDKIFSADAWSAHAVDYQSSAMLPVMAPALRDALYPSLDKALSECPADSKIPLLITACGSGGELKLLIERYGPGGPKADIGTRLKVLATDFAQGMVDQVNKLLQSKGDLRGEYTAEVQDAQRLNMPSESFSFALLLFGPMVLPDAAAAFRELHRVLKPGGTVIVSTFQSNEAWDIADLARAAVFAQRGGTGEPVPSVYDTAFVTPWAKVDDVIAKLAAAGFVDGQGKSIKASFVPPKMDPEMMQRAMRTNPGYELFMLGIKESETEAFQVAQKKATKERMGDGPLQFPMVANVAWAKKA